MQSTPTVLLRHTLPDGTSHVDWMIAIDDRGELVTFRMAERVDERPPGATVRSERIGDHRRLYLEHEGPLPGPVDRGSVTRLARGTVVASDFVGRDPVRLVIDWHEQTPPRRQTLRLAALDGAWWELAVARTDPGGVG